MKRFRSVAEFNGSRRLARMRALRVGVCRDEGGSVGPSYMDWRSCARLFKNIDRSGSRCPCRQRSSASRLSTMASSRSRAACTEWRDGLQGCSNTWGAEGTLRADAKCFSVEGNSLIKVLRRPELPAPSRETICKVVQTTLTNQGVLAVYRGSLAWQVRSSAFVGSGKSPGGVAGVPVVGRS